MDEASVVPGTTPSFLYPHNGSGSMAQLFDLAAWLEILVSSVAAAAGSSVGLVFALGAYPVIAHILAGHFLKQWLPRNPPIEVDGQRGLVERVGAVDNMICSDDRSWTV